jgi:hypothetical protein
MKQNKTATDNQPRGKQNKLSGDNLKNRMNNGDIPLL